MTAVEPIQEATIQLPPATRRIVLTGFMGAGKTTTGLALAARLGWEFLDLDRHLEARSQATIPALFERHGEPYFRRLESSALASALARTSTVIALGGGTPELHVNRLLLEQTPGTLTIFLDAPFPVLFDRCILQALNPGATHRPILQDPSLAEARFRTRIPHYRRLAHLTQKTEDLGASGTVAAILESLCKQKI